MRIGKKLKLIRITEGYTQKTFAELLRKLEREIQKYEYGKHIPSVEVIQRLCQHHPEYAVWLMTNVEDVSSVVNCKLSVSNKETISN